MKKILATAVLLVGVGLGSAACSPANDCAKSQDPVQCQTEVTVNPITHHSATIWVPRPDSVVETPAEHPIIEEPVEVHPVVIAR